MTIKSTALNEYLILYGYGYGQPFSNNNSNIYNKKYSGDNSINYENELQFRCSVPGIDRLIESI